MKPARERLASGSGRDDALLLMRRSATALAGAIRCGEVSAQDVVETHIEALQRWQPKINALAVERFDAARVEADAADARIAASTVDEDEPLRCSACLA
jgi:Asp-tRNA(Asn)/Glu-tRNA(Gln) amidotransferase A subunit family amidase